MSNRIKISLAAACVFAAIGTWFWSGRAERRLIAENTQALEGVTYHVQCSACKHVFDMPATDYVTELGDEGVKCPQCGQRKGWRSGTVGHDNEQLKAEAAGISSIEELRAASDEIAQQISELEEQLVSPEARADPAKEEQIQKQLAPLRARYHALGLRWDELSASGSQAP